MLEEFLFNKEKGILEINKTEVTRENNKDYTRTLLGMTSASLPINLL